MSRLLVVTFFSFILVQGKPVHADWSERGNGGDVIVCPSTGTHIMLDLYETHNRYHFETLFTNIPVTSSFMVGPEELTEMAESRIESNLNALDPLLKTRLLELVQEFNKSTEYLRNVELIDIQDSGVVHLPKDCALKQLIVQRRSPTSIEKTYVVSIDLWQQMRYESRLAAVLHEIIYRVALQINPKIKNSENLRYFNALILGERLKDYSTTEYNVLFERTFGVPKN